MLQRLISSVTVHDLIMNPEMNNNDRKKHSKTIAMAGIGFLLIAAAFTVPFASSGIRSVSAQQGGNATSVIVATPFDTFTANGAISGSVQEQGGGGNQSAAAGGGGGNQSAAAGGGGGNQSAAAGGGGGNQSAAAGGGNQSAAAGGGGGNQSAAAGGGGGNQSAAAGGGNQSGNTTLGQTVTGGGAETPYVLGGNWNLNVQGGNVTDFAANFVMVHQDGTGYHTHNITDFSAGNKTAQLIQGQPTSINGTADISVNGTTKWPGVDTTLTFTNNAAVMTINPAAEDTDNHFGGQPIYGIANQVTGENGTQIVQTSSPASPAQAEAQQGGGNQTGGNPLGGIGEQIGRLFGGGQ
jgi:hypothetical protein